MHIGLFGGVFNPPHIGHVLIAQQILDFTDIEEVWFLPNYGQHPPKPHVASATHRLAMTRLLALPKTNVSTIEMDNTLDGNTITLLPYLPRQHNFTFIMGADWLPSFTTWGQWETLLAKLPFLVFPRNGYPNTPLYKNMTLLEHQLLVTSNISSTLVRGRVKAGLPIDQFVPRGVVEYMRKHKIYQV